MGPPVPGVVRKDNGVGFLGIGSCSRCGDDSLPHETDRNRTGTVQHLDSDLNWTHTTNHLEMVSTARIRVVRCSIDAA